MRAKRTLMGGPQLDFEGGLIAGVFCAVYAAVVGGVRGVSTEMMSGQVLGGPVLLSHTTTVSLWLVIPMTSGI
ncbi:hypothetical protein ACFL3B_06475 [Gemmatimonadota bacterium]